MCLICGDTVRDHGSSVDAITWADVERAARANNMSVDQTKRNLDASLRMIQMPGGDLAGLQRGQAALRQKFGEPDTGGDELHPRELKERDDMLAAQGGIKGSKGEIIPADEVLARDDVPGPVTDGPLDKRNVRDLSHPR
jgi:hypothetical protein